LSSELEPPPPPEPPEPLPAQIAQITGPCHSPHTPLLVSLRVQQASTLKFVPSIPVGCAVHPDGT